MRAFPWLTFWDLICSHMLLEKIKYDFEFMSKKIVPKYGIIIKYWGKYKEERKEGKKKKNDYTGN